MKWKYMYVFSILSLLCFLFPVNTKAATFSVEAVKSTGATKAIGTYSDYNAARNAMNNYPSTESDVAVIKQNGKIVNARYAIVHLSFDKSKPLAENGNNEHRLYPTSTSNTIYTTVHAAYGNDAAFIDYDPYGGSNGRIKIKISGYSGWMNAPYATIIPISSLESMAWIASRDTSWLRETSSTQVKVESARPIGIRADHNTSSNKLGDTQQGTIYQFTDKYYDGTYTWYHVKISNSSLKTYYEHYNTGYLIHYFATYNSQGWTNLGKAPSFLNKGGRYYSFDGNYYYQSISSMLDDYRENTSKRSVNANHPYYPYYIYLPVHSKTKYKAEDFNQGIINRGYYSKAQSAMYGEGINFISSQQQYGVNALLTYSAALNESAAGTSKIALYKNNLFGHNAYGNDPYGQATTYSTVAEGIMAHARMTGQEYSNPYDGRYYGGHYGNKQSGMNVKYATDPYWGEKAANYAFSIDHGFGDQEFNGNTLGVITHPSVIVRKKPSNNGQMIYTMRNINTDVEAIPLTVTDRVYSEGSYWYKVYTDPSLNSNQDLDWSGTYDYEKSFGYINEKDMYVSNTQPVINAKDITINKGANLNLRDGVTATDKEDGDLTSSIKITGVVSINIPGTYKVTYTATDRQQFSVNKEITVTVKGEVEPVINAEDKEVVQYTAFDPKKGVSAKDDIEGDLTSKITVTGNVDTNKVGVYKVKYSVTNGSNKTVTKEIRVTVIENSKPVIHAEDKEININSTFHPLDFVTATDKEDGKLEKIEVIKNTVDTKKLGTYEVAYKVKDSANQEVTKTIKVTVKEKVLEKREAKYYLDYVKNKNGKLQFKGYNAITGIDNTKNTPISYTFEFVDINTEKVIFKQKAERLMNKEEMTMPVFSNDGHDYTYSWFLLDVDLKNLPEANYKIYVISETDTYYAKSIVNNKLFAPQITSFKGEKEVIIRNNYTTNESPIELLVRNEKISDRTTKTYSYNQFDQYLQLEFTANNLLHIMGTSYSYGLDLGKSANVNRNIIFEEKETYKKYQYSLDSILNGPYEVALPVSDSLGKTRAWYDKNIDISDLDKGVYTIYIANASNISDVSEFKDLLNRDVNKITKKMGSKTYSFQLNKKNNNVELIIK